MYLEQISIQNHKTQADRDFIFAKIEKTAQDLFKREQPKIKLFGSLVTGLALETSDMDLAVSGLQIEDRDHMIEKLGALADEIELWPF